MATHPQVARRRVLLVVAITLIVAMSVALGVLAARWPQLT
jgi:hypothetical protein